MNPSEKRLVVWNAIAARPMIRQKQLQADLADQMTSIDVVRAIDGLIYRSCIALKLAPSKTSTLPERAFIILICPPKG